VTKLSQILHSVAVEVLVVFLACRLLAGAELVISRLEGVPTLRRALPSVLDYLRPVGDSRARGAKDWEAC